MRVEKSGFYTWLNPVTHDGGSLDLTILIFYLSYYLLRLSSTYIIWNITHETAVNINNDYDDWQVWRHDKMCVQHLITALITYKHYIMLNKKQSELKIELITTKNTNSKKTLQTVFVILVNLFNEGRTSTSILWRTEIQYSHAGTLLTIFSLVIYKKS